MKDGAHYKMSLRQRVPLNSSRDLDKTNTV